MKLVVCAVKDSAAQAYMNPFFATVTGIAVRSFRDEANRKAEGNTLAAHPEDFELHHLGYFDPENGQFDMLEFPAVLLRGKDAVAVEQ